VVIEGFRQGLRQLGWVEGQNIALKYRWAEGRYDRLPDLAAELIHLFAHTAPAIQAAKQATSTTPIVMETLTDPVLAGFVASFARPGGNITGVSGLATELSGKRLELLKEAVPGVTRVAVLANPANPSTPALQRETESAARALGVQLHVLEVRDPTELDDAFTAMSREHADALIVLPDLMLVTQRKRIVDFAAKNRMPAMYADSRQWVESGGLMLYEPSLAANSQRAAGYVDKILKGAKPADLPVEQPTKFELVINLKTAKALGLTIPNEILFQADEVIR
jgi:putative ABC transport system substrate-binding protein